MFGIMMLIIIRLEFDILYVLYDNMIMKFAFVWPLYCLFDIKDVCECNFIMLKSEKKIKEILPK